MEGRVEDHQPEVGRRHSHMQRGHQNLQVISFSEVDERVLCDCDHVLVDQIKEEPIAEGELKDTLEEVDETNLG